jgi:hypothetical protein
VKYPQLFIDANDVERGYYVYAHRCKKTQQVFYVGKGKQERAWSDARSNAWAAYVQGLPMGYEVILLHKDLTEIESIDLERVEIDLNGGAASEGGRLVNWIPGEAGHGFGVAAVVEVSLGGVQTEDDKAVNNKCIQASIEARKYKKLSVEQKRNLENGYIDAVRDGFELIDKLHSESLDGDLEPSFIIHNAYMTYIEVCTLCRQLKNKKISFAEFCEQADSQIEGYERMFHKEEKACDLDSAIKDSCLRFAEQQVKWTRIYSDGTFEEANDASDREWIKHRYPASCEYDSDFERYVALTRVFFGDGRAKSVVRIRQELSTA